MPDRNSKADAEAAGDTGAAGELWDGGWEANAAAKRRDWATLTAGQLLEWLDDALDLALASGALDRDRRRRAAAACEWANPSADVRAEGSHHHQKGEG